MLALKKKREAEAKAAAAAADGDTAMTDANGGGEEKVSLLGVGGKKKATKTGKEGKKRTPGEIRIQKGAPQEMIRFERLRPAVLTHARSSAPLSSITDIAELDGGKVATIHFPNPNDLTSFDVSICPDSGYWQHATYHFTFTIPPHYPHSPPKVECKTKIYHPNIDLEGKVCLNILREDWKPVLDINSVIYGLIYLFYEPNPDDPLNHEAAELFRKDVRQFERLVSRTLRGGILDGVQFERLV